VQVIEWTNPGTVAHTITFDTATSLSDPTIAPGGTWEVKFSKAGTYTYKCTIHPGMDGKLTVS
jgi:plastocyanin